ncbi:ATP-binding cassette domain-containing protein [Spiractinospora alimapuensis]|uniref:methionine ABC transporter ATP-binding protein n=1 Tax=Spiractinospora alimapuensis TaxID=2820884 RepID=UPI001F23FCCD|nr:ATP-binding cassette domain-containing protein [Spiractinospora alimapuensis]QVQ53067.1 ATP-binding cassette domain-containing protein [Spiractinospora alimapuensis]
MIEATQLRKVFRSRGQETTALDGVDLHVEPGEVYGVVGQSGAGKSTLLRSVNLLERPTSGTVRVHGRELTSLAGSELRAARRDIGMVHQHFALLSARTAAGNVAFPLEVMGMGRAERRRRVAELLDVVGLGDKARSFPAQLSGGQKQRVGIARAIAANPAVLLCDEATSALDPATTDSILDLLRQLNRDLGITILLITHEMNVIKRVCDSAAIMSGGRFLEKGRVIDLLRTPGSLLARSLFPLTDGGPDSVVLTYAQRADDPVISDVSRRFGVDVNILGGSVETVAEGPVGRLSVTITGDRRAEAVEYLRGLGLGVEQGATGLGVEGTD